MRRAYAARRRTQSTSRGSRAAPWTPQPPATISVSDGSRAAGSGAAANASPADDITEGAWAATTRGAYGIASPRRAAKSFALANTCSGPVTSSNCTSSNASTCTARRAAAGAAADGVGGNRGDFGISAIR